MPRRWKRAKGWYGHPPEGPRLRGMGLWAAWGATVLTASVTAVTGGLLISVAGIELLAWLTG